MRPGYVVDGAFAILSIPSDEQWSPVEKVPEGMQLNASKKQREMILLEESLRNMRTRFNRRFLALRDIKREILTTVTRDNRRLKEIDAELGYDDNDGEAAGGVLLGLVTIPDPSRHIAILGVNCKAERSAHHVRRLEDASANRSLGPSVDDSPAGATTDEYYGGRYPHRS